ncbi:HAMP domain-containing histidine kinase [Nocardia gipuzkoensis]|uniref:sensor histidine kinase n=1 Tax=Nocardia gipuzkoensis TaxID=2749991 RepID=UPI001E3FA668|nr:HAMP domain-containing sensor histidine kinase [Nocardia gipuzkoensis]UGT66396.1 HAMP domain-containing histidine kinase [Nocardia gipuzkoensis]
MAERERKAWWRSVRARTTVAATVVVAVALTAAGLAVLAVLRHNLVESAELQAETTARDVATQLAAGAELGRLTFPDAESQPVQIVSADRRVLAAADDLAGKPPMADFGPHSKARDDEEDEDDEEEDDEDEADDENSPSSAATPATAEVEFRDIRLTVEQEDGPHPYRVAALAVTVAGGQPATVYAGSSLETADSAVADARQAMLIGLTPLLAVVAAVTWLVTRRALRPVEAIRRQLAEIMDGDLSRRVPEPGSRDEIARLASTTNATLAALEESAERQRRFVADAAHELRSPIASLRTQLEVAQAHPKLLELDGLIVDTIRLEHLAADLLLLARLDAGEQPRPDRVDLAALVHEELEHRVGDRVAVQVAVPEQTAAVTGSRTQLARVLGNLVDNAQRHAASTVRVAVERGADGRVVLSVADDGPGVPHTDRDRIFQRFVRLDDARTRDEGGAGLGLAIVRDVVERHGGTIRVTDGAPGGACFVVSLPVAGA